MARLWKHRRALAAAFAALAAAFLAPALAQDQGPSAGTDLYDRPVLAVDPGMHTATIWSEAVDREGRYAVTGGADRTVRIWSIAERKLLRTIWIPAGPEPVGIIIAVAISPDGTTVAAGGFTERADRPHADHPIYVFDRDSGALIRLIHGELSVNFMRFSPDGRFLAVTMARGGLRVFDRAKDWSLAYGDESYGAGSSGATFALDGRLATTSQDGMIRLYAYAPSSDRANFHLVGHPIKAPSGTHPFRLSFSPDGSRLAVGYGDVGAVDILNAATLMRVGGQSPTDIEATATGGLSKVAWSRDGQTLFAAGAALDQQGRTLLFAWDRSGLGRERQMRYCTGDTAADIDALPDGQILVASMMDCLGLMDRNGKPIWTDASPILDFAGTADMLKVSKAGDVVDFGDRGSTEAVLRFDLRSLTMSGAPQSDDLTHAPNREGVTIDGWRNDPSPTLDGRALPMQRNDVARSLAIAPDAKRFFLGSSFALAAFDDEGNTKWRRASRGEVWAVNASSDGRLVVAAYGDGTIRWHRADDGRELLALQVLPNKTDWVLWTPEGFYEATSGARGVLKWVVNHGPDSPATTLPVSAIPKLHRPDALPLVLDELETARALGIADVAAARLAVQKATGSAKPPGGALHVLAIGVDKFGDKAGALHLDYAAEDAHDVASALLESQMPAPGKASLYADVSLTYLPNDKAYHTAILDALDGMAKSMATNGSGQDVAVILVSSHGEMIDGQFYLIPYDFDAGSQNRSTTSAVSASEFAKKVQALASHGKVLLLLDACHSGAVGAGGWATDPDAKVLQDAMDMENVTVLTSSKKNELSEELPAWKHGALAQAFLDALAGAADPQGIVRLSALTDAMENELQSLTKGRQHLGMHVNFNGDLFVAGHY